MDIRYSTGPNDVKRYTTEELRKEFLIQDPDGYLLRFSETQLEK